MAIEGMAQRRKNNPKIKLTLVFISNLLYRFFVTVEPFKKIWLTFNAQCKN